MPNRLSIRRDAVTSKANGKEARMIIPISNQQPAIVSGDTSLGTVVVSRQKHTNHPEGNRFFLPFKAEAKLTSLQIVRSTPLRARAWCDVRIIYWTNRIKTPNAQCSAHPSWKGTARVRGQTQSSEGKFSLCTGWRYQNQNWPSRFIPLASVPKMSQNHAHRDGWRCPFNTRCDNNNNITPDAERRTRADTSFRSN